MKADQLKKPSISPNIWGKYGWPFIHMVAKCYPKNPTKEDKINYRNFFLSLQNVLPCGSCCVNYTSHLAELPITEEVLANQDSLLKWTIDLHNIVNRDTGKPMLSYEEALTEINNMTKTNSSNHTWYIFVIIIVVVILCLLFCYFFDRKKIE
jgi:hypothetical protein